MLRTLVSGSSSQLSERSQTDSGARIADAPYLRVPLGSGVFTGVGQALSAVPEADEQVVPRRRDDETYINVRGESKYLYRAVDSTGQTVDFLLTAKRDAAGAKRFFRKAFQSTANPSPRVINVDKNPAYPVAIKELKAEGTLSKRSRLRQCRYLNNIVEQDHRTVKRRARLAMGYGSFRTAWKTLQGIETMHMINKGRVRWLAMGDVVGQVKFFGKLFGIAA